MISVMHCKFLKISEYKKSDNTKFYKLTILEETDKKINTLEFYISNEIALNCKDIQYMQNIGISFDLWFSTKIVEKNKSQQIQSVLSYKIKNIVIEK